MGLKVGILDADIYGPSQALLHQTTTTPDVKDGLITPLDRQNVQLMSIALISPTDKALNWRGPMIAKALLQMFIQTDWDALDYLLVDLPPGTGDIQMSLCQQLPITGYVSVTHIHPLSIETTSRFEKAMQLMSVPQIIKIYNQSPQESIHHIPYTPQYQNLQPAVDQQILKLATCFALRMNQLPILSTQHRS
jgi:ATP-binding protein involved in chromosome partitioning